MGKIVPMISSGVVGPLGVLHLPRFWQKMFRRWQTTMITQLAGKLRSDDARCARLTEMRRQLKR